jgi:polysaccharide export outer membrane protein
MRFLKTLVIAVQLIFVCVALSGCLGSSSLGGSDFAEGTFQETAADKGIGGKAATDAQKIFSSNATPANPAGSKDYKVAALDVLEVTVFGVKDLDRTVQVSSSGMISLPLINTVRAGGRTVPQLEKDIANKLQASYLQSPQVSVFVKEYNSERITVDGAVKKPGIFPTTGSVSLLQAIALAEGITEIADPTGILLFRTVENKRLAARFDLKQIRSGKQQDPMLQAGDIVMVDESSARTTLRDVKSALPLTGVLQLLLL